MGDYWRSTYGTATFDGDVVHLVDELLPLYRQLHAYARRQLVRQYGRHRFPYTGHIPAHLLGDGDFCQFCVLIIRKEENVLFNDAVNTFYLRLYGVSLKKEMFYLTTQSTHFNYGYMVSV